MRQPWSSWGCGLRFPVKNEKFIGKLIRVARNRILDKIYYVVLFLFSHNLDKLAFYVLEAINDKTFKYNIKESDDWKVSDKRRGEYQKTKIKLVNYRPFDKKYIYYSKDLIDRDRFSVMKHMLLDYDNVALAVARQCSSDWRYVFISNTLIESNLTGTAGKFGSGYLCPLYSYPNENLLETQRIPNLNLEIVKEIEEKLNLKFVSEKKEDNTSTFAPIDILDYIYAVLYSPNYRAKYTEFLKIDFPRVPFPDIKTFWKLVSLGGRLRTLHLMEDESLNDRIIDIKGEAALIISNKLNKNDTIIENGMVTLNINKEVSIINIPLIAWEFYIGGYQPAQKWLKDREGRELNRNDLKHYNKIINALFKTNQLMQEIDGVLKVQ